MAFYEHIARPAVHECTFCGGCVGGGPNRKATQDGKSDLIALQLGRP